jgi:hypothetical protein
MIRTVKVTLSQTELMDLLMNKARRAHTTNDRIVEEPSIDFNLSSFVGTPESIGIHDVLDVVIIYREELER